MGAFIDWILEHGADNVDTFAVIIVVYLFIDFLKKQCTAHRQTISNHINHSTEAAEKQTDAINELTGILREMKGTLAGRDK